MSGRPGVFVAILLALLGAAGRPAVAADRESNGRRVFEAKQCVRCHVPGGNGSGPPLEQIRRPQGLWELTGRFWNHVPVMFTALTASGVEWPRLTAEESTDLMSYLAATADADPGPEAGRGLAVLVQKGCLKCHALRGEGGRVAPELTDRAAAFASPATWAARIWTHTPGMAAVAMQRGVNYPRFSGPEMAHLVAYLKSAGAAPAPRQEAR